jgi:serine/threonine protein kinase
VQFAWDKKKPYLVLEWYPELNLKILISKGYDSYAHFLPKIIPDMAKALAYLHEKGWVHRDVKPDNFLYGESGGLKLIDFALAKKCTSGMFSFQRKAQGTASYIAPEQILTRKVDPRSDVYSLGCTFFELIAGRPPYTGGTINDLLQKHITSAIPPITARNKNVTPEMAEIVQLCLAKDPKDRPSSSKDLYDMVKTIRVYKQTPKNSDVN